MSTETTKTTKVMTWVLTAVFIVVISLGVLGGVTSMGGSSEQGYTETSSTSSSPF